MKLEDKYIRFVNNITTTISDEQMIKIKFVDFQKLYNFVVVNISIWINLLLQNVLWICHLPSGKIKHSAEQK